MHSNLKQFTYKPGLPIMHSNLKQFTYKPGLPKRKDVLMISKDWKEHKKVDL